MRLIFASEERQIAETAANLAASQWMVEQSRNDYNRLIEEYNNTVAESNDHLARFDALLEKYHALRLGGAVAPVVPTKRAPDKVLEVISDVAGSNAPLRGMLGRYARQQRAAKVDDDQIIQTLMHWPDADEEAEA